MAAEAIPIQISDVYATLRHRLEQGTLAEVVARFSCPICNGRLSLTKSVVSRGATWLRGREFVFEVIEIPIARCIGLEKKHRIRVLPADIQPRKTFSIKAQEMPATEYLEGDCGLRAVVGSYDGESPHYSTLHGWLGALGGYARGWSEPEEAVPVAVVREESRRRFFSDLDRCWDRPVSIDPRRYRSEQRHDLLAASKRLLRCAPFIAAEAVSPLAEWNRLILGFGTPSGMLWWARFSSTPIQLLDIKRDGIASPGNQPSSENMDRCRPRTRSPPGASK